jgi:hypothetical protein
MKVFLAATEDSETSYNMQFLKIENIFMSYYYMRQKKDAATLIFNRQHAKTIIVDSGAHTFFSENSDEGLTVSVHTKKTKTKETPEEYFENYLLWAKKYYDYYDYFVELDIGELVGQDVVIQWRERLKQHGIFDKCITVMHPATCTYEEYLKMLDDSESKYVALEGLRAGTKQIAYGKYLIPAYNKKVKVHGFALTNKKIIDKYPFFSVDSSSWKAGLQYGTFAHSVDGVSKAVSFKDHKWELDMSEPNLIDVFNPHLKTQRLARLRLSVKSYKDMQTFYTKVWKARGISFDDFQVNENKEYKDD